MDNIIWHSVVRVAACYELEGPVIKSLLGRDFPHPSRPTMGAPQASYTIRTGWLYRR